MRPLTTVILFVLLAAVGGYIFLLNRGEDPSGTSESDSRILPGFRAQGVTDVEVTNEFGSYRFKRGPSGEWLFQSPLVCRADIGAIAALLSPLEFIEHLRRLETPLPEYGLENPRATLKVKGPDPSSCFDLAYGSEDALQQNLWVQIKNSAERDGVFVVEKKIFNPIHNDILHFRDRTLFNLRTWDVDGFSIAGPNGTLEAKREARTTWYLGKPIAARGDLNRIRELLNSLLSTRISTFVQERADDLAGFSLDPPRFKIEVWSKAGGGIRESLSVGSVNSQGELHGRSGESPTVVTLPQELLQWLETSPDELRDPQVFSTIGLEVASAVVSPSNGATYRLFSDEENPPRSWVEVDDRARNADPEESAMITSMVRRLRAVAFRNPRPEELAGLGLDPPTTRLRFSSPDKERELELNVGSPLDDDPSLTPVSNGTEATVFLVPTPDLEPARRQPFHFLDKQRLDIRPEDVESFRITTEDGSSTFELSGSEADRVWRGFRSGEDAVDVNQTEVHLFLERFAKLRAIRFLAEDPSRRAEFGLEKPRLTLELKLSPESSASDGKSDVVLRYQPTGESLGAPLAPESRGQPRQDEPEESTTVSGHAEIGENGLVFEVSAELLSPTKKFLERTLAKTPSPGSESSPTRDEAAEGE